MLKEHAEWAPAGFYISGSEWEPLAFFSEGLSHANSFDLLLGFFSSSAIEVLSDSFALFLYRGGNMRLVINNLSFCYRRNAVKECPNSTCAICARCAKRSHVATPIFSIAWLFSCAQAGWK